MPVYVALLRGVNVGGRKLPMKTLAATLTGLGLDDVVTYIQSGNAVFRAPAGARAKLTAEVEAAVSKAAGYEVTVLLRTPAELAKVVEGNPYLDAKAETSKLYVVFLASKPAKAVAAKLDPDRSPPDEFALEGSEIYLHLPNGSGRSKLGGDYFERTLRIRATARNWRTVTKLFELSG